MNRRRFLIKAGAAFAIGGGFVGASTDEENFQPIFDGRTLAGWKQTFHKGADYFVEDGMLVCPADGKGKLFTEKEYSNFILRLAIRMEPGGNNGIGIRAPLIGQTSKAGMEIQILDDYFPQYQVLRASQYHGSIYDVLPARRGFLKPAGQWNEEEITADGRHVQVKLNGTIILDANLDSIQDPQLLRIHPGLSRPSGRIVLLGHTARVEFRNLRIRELPGGPAGERD